MTIPIIHIHPKQQWPVVFLLIWLLVTACSEQEPTKLDKIKTLVPNLPNYVAEVFVYADDSTLVEYLKQTKLGRIDDLINLVAQGRQYDTVDNFKQTASVIDSILSRLFTAQQTVYGRPASKLFIWTQSQSAERIIAMHKLRLQIRSLNNDRNIREAKKIQQIKHIMSEAEKLELDLVVADCKSAIARIYREIGNMEASLCYSLMALDEYKNFESINMYCQELGLVGSIYRGYGRIDSMVACYEEALSMSRLYVLPDQTTRILRFYADYYKSKGRLSLAHDLYNQALETCRLQLSGQAEAYFLIRVMRFQADYDVWEMIPRLLPQARAAQQQLASTPIRWQNRNSLDMDQLEARYLMAVGRADEAELIFKRIKKLVHDLNYPMLYAMFLHDWAEGLFNNHCLKEAELIIQEGYECFQKLGNTVRTSQLLILSARTQFELGQIEASKEILDRFESLGADPESDLQHEWVARDALRVKIYLAESHDREAVRALEDGTRRIERLIKRMEKSIHGYLWLGGCNNIRQLLHDEVKEDPLLGYGLEFYWRNFYRLMGSSAEGDSLGLLSEYYLSKNKQPERPALREQLHEVGEKARAAVVKAGAIHCVYLVRNGDVWRWTCSQAGVHQEVLKISADQLRMLVSKTWGSMSIDPGDENTGLEPELINDLYNLSQILLPDELLVDSENNKLLFVTADGFLAQFPFETLNFGKLPGYDPLLKHFDVAYVRHTDTFFSQGASAPGIILANNTGGGQLRGNYLFQRDLEKVFAEGKAVSTYKPGSVFLYGDSATKVNLFSYWEKASFIYLASHLIQDPAAPYLVLVPLASPDNKSAPEISYLDMSDIRSANLNQCDLVVLSSCSSGAPYIGARNTAPALGEVFLDAGAGAAIQTFWDVSDEQAQELMSSFAKEWGSSSSPAELIKALSKIRRESMNGSAGIRHPFNWAAYAINIGRF